MHLTSIRLFDPLYKAVGCVSRTRSSEAEGAQSRPPRLVLSREIGFDAQDVEFSTEGAAIFWTIALSCHV